MADHQEKNCLKQDQNGRWIRCTKPTLIHVS